VILALILLIVSTNSLWHRSYPVVILQPLEILHLYNLFSDYLHLLAYRTDIAHDRSSGDNCFFSMIHFGQTTPPRLLRPTLPAVLAAIALVLGTSGCVQRRMMIRSNPSGALVYVDDYEIGTTPVSADFIYYGKRKIRLVKDGCETLTVMQDIRPPWYEIVPFDFISENLVPGTITDRRTLDFQLRPQMVVPTDQLQARAEELRRTTHGSAAAPLAQPTGVMPQQQPVVPYGNNPPVSPPLSGPPPAAPEMLPVPPGVGGQPVRPVQP
jgi:hypothetical protein